MAEEYTPPAGNNADFNFEVAGYAPPAPGEADFDFSTFIYRVLIGSSNIFTGIWADSNAGRNSGKMYAISWGPGVGLSVLNLETKSLYDRYTTSYGGRAEETLTNDDTRDLNVDTP